MQHHKNTEVLQLAKKYYESIADLRISTDSITIEDLFSLTNDVYKVSDGHDHTILVKIYQPSL